MIAHLLRGFLVAAALIGLAAAPAHAEAAMALRHLPNNIQGYRLSGEIGASEWPVYLSPAQALSRLKFRLGYLSAASVMPEASTLTVFVNDQPIGATPVAAPNEIKTVEFDVPAGLLQPGFNAVRIGVDQRHRVDCSLQGTFELWTQIDPSETGLLLPAEVAGAGDAAEIAALPPDGGGALPVRAVLGARVSAADIERTIQAVEIIASGGHFEQPAVDVGPPAGGPYGVNLIVGQFDDIKDFAGLADLGAVAGPRVVVRPPTSDLRTTIVITGANEDDVNSALNAFAAPAPPRGSPAGLRAARAFPGYRVAPGETVRLADLGLRSEEFSGRYFRAEFNIAMPADFYSADYAKLPLDLAGGYGPGLASTAQVIVAINGRNALSASLPRANGDVFKDMRLPLPLGYLKPGLNRIEIQAQLPTGADAACDVAQTLGGAKRFLFLDSTTIEIPSLARIGRMPDLAVTAGAGFPFVGAGKQPKLYAPSPDRESIAAAATLAGRMAASAGRPIPFRFTTTAPAVGSGATLVVAPLNRLDDATLSAFALDPAGLRQAWDGRSTADAPEAEPLLSAFDQRARARQALQKNLPAACPLRRPRAPAGVIDADAAPAANAPPTRDLYAEWSQDLTERGPLRRWANMAARTIAAKGQSAWTFARARLARWAPQADGADEAKVRPDDLFFIAQTLRGDSGDSVWTLVSAPNSQLLAQSAACLADPRVWGGVKGRLALFDGVEGRMRAAPAPALRFVETQPLSLGNMRLIAAGWLSLNRAVYVALALAAAAALAFATFHFVNVVGRRQE